MSLTASPPRQQIVDKINSYLQTNGTITAIEHKEIELLLVDAIYGAQIGDIKEIACDVNYINTNFDMTGLNPGLGRATKPDGSPGERYGWAVCNGKNGTIDKRGNVSVGYDPSVSIFSIPASINTQGSQGGARDVTLTISQMPQHNHQVILHKGNDLNFSENYTYTGPVGLNGVNATISGPFILGTDDSHNSFKKNATANMPGDVLYSGGGQSHENMQPYIVTLFIQRIPV